MFCASGLLPADLLARVTRRRRFQAPARAANGVNLRFKQPESIPWSERKSYGIEVWGYRNTGRSDDEAIPDCRCALARCPPRFSIDWRCEQRKHSLMLSGNISTHPQVGAIFRRHLRERLALDQQQFQSPDCRFKSTIPVGIRLQHARSSDKRKPATPLLERPQAPGPASLVRRRRVERIVCGR